MIRICFVCFFLLGGSAFLASDAFSTLFQSSYASSAIRANWYVTTDTNTQASTASRQANTISPFSMLASMEPGSQRHYEYLDHAIDYGLGSAPLTYQVVELSSVGQKPFHKVLSDTPSVIQRSWGTIKSMFR